MSKVESWKDPIKIAKLVELVEEEGGGFVVAAKHFNVSQNSVRSAYARRNMANKSPVPISNNLQSPEDISDNPFEIKTDMVYSGTRLNVTLIAALAQQILKLEVNNKMQSVNIPVTVSTTKSNAQSLILAVRKVFVEDSKNNNVEIISKSIFDAKNQYVGTRVWRIQ